MTTQPANPPGGEPTPPGCADLHVKMTCPDCRRPVTRVRTRAPSEWVVLDGKDSGGAWYAVKIAGRWRMVKPEPGEDPPGAAVRYREHDCRMTAATAAVRKMVESVGPGTFWAATTDGPCAGNCGATVTAYGPNAQILCGDCGQVLDAWRELPARERGSIPYGRLVDGVYRHPDRPGP